MASHLSGRSAARTAQREELAKLPVAVDVITSEFMRDLGAFSLDDVARTANS